MHSLSLWNRAHEMAHVEMIATIVKQLMKGAIPKELMDAGLTGQYVQHGHAFLHYFQQMQMEYHLHHHTFKQQETGMQT